MKKLPDDYRLRQQRIADDRFKRKKISRVKRGYIRPRYISGYEIIFAPESFSMVPENIDEVIYFVQDLGSKGKTGKKITIDFADTKFMSALGAVYVHSEISNIQDAAGSATVRIRTETVSNSQVWHTLKNTGIFRLCGNLVRFGDGVLPIIRGKDDGHLPDITAYLMDTALFREPPGLTDRNYAERLINKAIGEAMLNVKYHAYPQNEVGDFWWATAAIIQNELHIALCDRGVGIPQTLLSQSWFQRLKGALKPGADDAEMIQKAMAYTRSSRTASGVGLGSRDIQQLVLAKGTGHLTIISGMGHYRLQGGNQGQSERATKINYDVSGTLIQWRIPLHIGDEL